jgi:hypothetical protein
MSDLLGKNNQLDARHLIAESASSKRFAQILQYSLSSVYDKLVSADDFWEAGNVFFISA